LLKRMLVGTPALGGPIGRRMEVPIASSVARLRVGFLGGTGLSLSAVFQLGAGLRKRRQAISRRCTVR